MEDIISIVIPVHNAESCLEETVQSVFDQTYGDYECILVDDGSTDGSRAVMEKLAGRDKRVRLVINEGKHGAANARNAGIKSAKGRYLAYLDADDKWHKDKLKRTLKFMKKQDAAFVFTGYEFGDEECRGTGKKVHVPDSLSYDEALSRTVIFTSTVMLDMKRLGKKVIMMPDVESEDTACWWQILKTGVSARGLNANLVTYRRTKGSLSSDKMTAIRRIWQLYRKQEGLGLIKSALCFTGWAFRATARRL